MSEPAHYCYFECPRCGWNSDEAGKLLINSHPGKICTPCAKDRGFPVLVKLRRATREEQARLAMGSMFIRE